METVSIIVPVYNKKNTIRRCIDSIRKQSFSDLQLILVDDGGTDQSAEICNEFASLDSRVVVIHKRNNGVSSARNIGIEFCYSQYITFCDSDDYLEADWISFFIQSLKESKADVVSADMQYVAEDGSLLKRTHFIKGKFDLGNEESLASFIVNELLKDLLGWQVCTRIYNSHVIKDNNIRFSETCEDFAEDLGFNLLFSIYCNNAATSTSCGYYYVQHDSSMMHICNSEKLNALNEISKQFGERYLREGNVKQRARIFPMLHYIIMDTEYRKAFWRNRPSSLYKSTFQIFDYEWYHKWTSKAFTSHKYFDKYLGKQRTKEAMIVSSMCLFNTWQVYDFAKSVRQLILNAK